MRVVNLWLSTLLLTACAHGGQESSQRAATPEIAAHRQDLQQAAIAEPPPETPPDVREQAHPARGLRDVDRPAVAAARGPRDPDERGASVATAMPPPKATAPIALEIEPTAPAPAAPLPPSRPSRATDVTAPMRNDEGTPPPELGADIARADADLRERVQRALLASTSLSYTAKHVHVDVAQHNVTLRGEVRTARERAELEEIVRALPGVRDLHNQVALINRRAVPRVP